MDQSISRVTVHSHADYGKLREAEVDGTPMYVIRDVADAPGVTGMNAMADSLPTASVAHVALRGDDGRRHVYKAVDADGLRFIVSRSNQAAAVGYLAWLNEDVLPSAGISDEDVETMAHAALLADKRISELEEEVERLRSEPPATLGGLRVIGYVVAAGSGE
jgi:prophage antirepressor-like protein